MICRQCRYQIMEESNFCPICGAQQVKIIERETNESKIEHQDNDLFLKTLENKKEEILAERRELLKYTGIAFLILIFLGTLIFELTKT